MNIKQVSIAIQQSKDKYNRNNRIVEKNRNMTCIYYITLKIIPSLNTRLNTTYICIYKHIYKYSLLTNATNYINETRNS